MGVDISSAGVGITSSIPLQGGEVVLLTLPVGELGARIPVYAEVVWQQPQRGAFRTGLRFLA
jgi:Tfp pilus assembly protein PilZ